MKFRVLQLAYFETQLVYPGDIVESDADLSVALAPLNTANPPELAPVYERVDEGTAP